jgi:hypothetical protein
MAGDIANGRWTADIGNDDIVVFLVGMRINSLWRVRAWLPIFMTMGRRMLPELFRDPSLGLLAARTFWSGRVILVLQYWRSFEQLIAYSRSTDQPHLPAWRDFNRRIRDNGSVGIWHETYRVGPGRAEAIYGNMPRFGLALATSHIPVAAGRHAATTRMDPSLPDEPAVAPY